MKKDKNKNLMTKNPILYIVMLFVWTALAVFLWYNFITCLINENYFNIPIENISTAVRVLAKILLAFNAIFISYFWLNGVKDFIYVVWYYCNKKD